MTPFFCQVASNHPCCNKTVSFQNELIIQIMTEGHEIDSLKRKIEDAKMKLVTEMKVQDFPSNSSNSVSDQALTSSMTAVQVL